MGGVSVQAVSLPSTNQPLPTTPKRRSVRRRLTHLVSQVLLLYLATAYVIAPAMWKRYTRRHPSLYDLPGITRTGAGIPGDPLNSALIGTKAEVAKIMLAA